MAPGSGWELPPRARRILKETRLILDQLGTTSACAENTSQTAERSPHRRNYLRVRGEYLEDYDPAIIDEELPPRARRILLTVQPQIIGVGTTSACAENTRDLGCFRETRRNYLRVRGEYGVTASMAMRSTELPPRARRIPNDFGKGSLFTGTTSACAENTISPAWSVKT